MTTSNLFSVIIPTYNRAAALRRALDSLVGQTFQEFQAIVSDDGSSDDTRAVVESFADKLAIDYVWNPNWGGPARPRNVAVGMAKTEWLCFLDSDDWWYPEKLAEVSSRLADADLIFHDLDRYQTAGGRPQGVIKGRALPAPVFPRLMLYTDAIPNSSVTVRKSLVTVAGGFTEDRELIATEDFDLWVRISRLTDRFVYLPVSLGAYWISADSITESGTNKQIQRIVDVYSRHLGFLDPYDRSRAELALAYRSAAVKVKTRQFAAALSLCRIALAGKSAKVQRWFFAYVVKECFGFIVRRFVNAPSRMPTPSV
jgi:glycosyltransferase involved in cell wall biosynthesis